MTDKKEIGVGLIGAWKMVSCTAEVEGESEIRYPLGHKPNGYVIITANHRIMALITTGDPRQPATSEAEYAQLMKTMMGYSGRFVIDEEKFVTTPDVTATGSYVGTPQTRYYTLDGDNLTIRSGRQTGGLIPGKTAVTTNVFVREK